MKKIKYLIIAPISSIIFGCSSEPYENYISLWENNHEKKYNIVEIFRDGDSIILSHMKTNKDGIFKNTNDQNILKINEGQLSLKNLQLGVSEDNNTLRYGSRNFKRITQERLKEIKSEMIETTKSDIKNIRNIMDQYRMDNMIYPKQSNGINALINKPYLESKPIDPWGNSYKYANPGTHGEIDIYCKRSRKESNSYVAI